MSRRAAAVVLAALLGAIAACRRSPPARGPAPAATTPREAANTFLRNAFSVLDRYEDFDEQRALELVHERITQWQRSAPQATFAWRPDPLVDTLPAELRAAAGAPALDADAFAMPDDVVWIRDERWLAFIAQTARGHDVRDIEVARNLFAWTVQSLAPVADPPLVAAADTRATRWFLPGDIVLVGRASAAQRAWIFLALVRHAGLDGAMLGVRDSSGSLIPWIPAVVCDGEAYLFEPAYGLPIPGPGGTGIATVRHAAEDPSILAALSLPERPYPVQADDLDRVGVLVAADPRSLSRRMAALDRAVQGLRDEGRGERLRDMRLVVDATRTGTKVVAALPVGDRAQVRLWEFPWTTLAMRRSDRRGGIETSFLREYAPLLARIDQPPAQERPQRPDPVEGTESVESMVRKDRKDRRDPGLVRPLFAARLRDFRGEDRRDRTDPDERESAKAAYLAARLSREAIAAEVGPLPPAEADAARVVLNRMRGDAAYWLGVLLLREGEYEAAIDYLGRMTLDAAPDGAWADAARQNLARAYEALQRPAEAIAVLRNDESPQRFGSRLEAARLERGTAQAPP